MCGWELCSSPALFPGPLRPGVSPPSATTPITICTWPTRSRGAASRGLEYLNINVYPLVLIGLHRMGLDWIFAAKMWGVLTGTAIVLPLFDWLRRMFNDRIALLAVFLYAVHPRIVEPTVEPLREATFWFFFVVCLDLFWRAAEERRTWQFAAGGLSLALALHTRIEAWFLLAPLGVWMGMSWWQSRAARPHSCWARSCVWRSRHFSFSP